MTNEISTCHQLLEKLNGLRPIAPDQETRILQKLRLEWDFHSNHLEGNSLSYGETRALILHGLTAQGKPLRDHLELSGHHEAVIFLEDLVRKTEPLTEAVIRHLHELILKEDHYIDARTDSGTQTRMFVQVGSYKTMANHVQTITGETLLFSSPADTPIHMAELLEWYRSARMDPIELASRFHHRFTRIHPFTDGNGRVARLLTNFILMMSSYPPVIVRTEEKNEYFAALRQADADNPEALTQYLAKLLQQSLLLVIRGAQGEEIEEPEDTWKELQLIRHRFETDGKKVSIVRSADAVRRAWNQWIRDLSIDFEAKFREFDSFYLNKEIYIGNSNQFNNGSFETQLESIGQSIEGVREVSLRIQFRTLKKREHVNRSFLAELKLSLLDTHIEVHGQDNSKLGEADWDEIPDLSTRQKWIATEAKRHVAFLKLLVNTPK